MIRVSRDKIADRITARRLLGPPLRGAQPKKNVYKTLGYLIGAEHRVKRKQSKRFDLEYRMVEELHPFFSDEAKRVARSPWKTLATFDDVFLARKALLYVLELWTVDDYLKADQKPEKAAEELKESLEKISIEE